MDWLLVGLLVVLVILSALLLIAVLATGAVVAQLAAHMRHDTWERIISQHRILRRREQHLTRNQKGDMS